MEEEVTEGELVEAPRKNAAVEKAADWRTEQRDRIREKLLRYTDRATQIIIELAELGENERVRLAAAQDLLDRAGIGKTQDTNITVSVAEHEIATREAEELVAKLNTQKQAEAQRALPKAPDVETLFVHESDTDELPVAIAVDDAVETTGHEER